MTTKCGTVGRPQECGIFVREVLDIEGECRCAADKDFIDHFACLKLGLIVMRTNRFEPVRDATNGLTSQMCHTELRL